MTEVILPLTVDLEVSGNSQVVSLSLETEQTYAMSVDTEIRTVAGEAYQGDYQATPSDEVQTIPTAGLYMREDFTIEPIPSNYGLITWDGSTLTVS